MTNFEKCKSMTVDELADFLNSGIDAICFESCKKSTGNKFECPIKDDVKLENCKECAKRWLTSKAEE